MASTIGKRLGRALDRKDISQALIAKRTGMTESAISKIITGETASPFFASIEKIIRAAELTWGEVFDEPQLRLSEEDARIAREFQGVLDRVLDNDSRQKEISRSRGLHILRDAKRPATYDEVENLPTEKIPAKYQLVHANRAYRVLADTMIEVGILEGATIFARASQDKAAADGEIVVGQLNGKLYLRRLDLRGSKTTLLAANPRYDPLHVGAKDRFALVAVVCTM